MSLGGSQIFCPRCAALVLDAATCASCGWERPAAPGAGRPAWQAALDLAHGRNLLIPAVAAGVWCLPLESGQLVALDAASGERLWARRLDEHAAAMSLAATDELLLVGLADTRPIPSGERAFLALRPRTGEVAWSYPTAGHSLSAAAVDQALYFTSSDGRIHALGHDGRPLWTRSHPTWGPAAPVVAGALVVAGGRGETLAAYDAATGAPRWQFTGASWLAGELVVAGGRLFTVAFDGTLYALDAERGTPLWQARGQRGKGFTSPPAVAGDRLFIGDRVYVEDGGARAGGYALRALGLGDGADLGRSLLPKRLQLAPAAVQAGEGATLLVCCADDGICYALDPASLAERWRYSGGQPFVAAPCTAGDLLILADEAGAAVALHLRAPSPRRDPAALLAAGATREAAAAYALAGDLPRGAQLYAQLGHARAAAALYERAGLAAQAAALWAQAGDRDKAVACYEAAGDLAAAAALYAHAGEHRVAAERYRQAGQHERAAEQWAALGDWGRQVEELFAAGMPLAAARVLEGHGAGERAAAAYEQAGDLAMALPLRRALGQWRQVADLAARLELPAEEAAAREQLGELAAAAALYERAAERALEIGEDDSGATAELFVHAAALYDQLGEARRAEACRGQIRRLRALPDLVTVGRAASAFAEQTWNELTVTVENRGHGPARNVKVAVEGPFESFMPAVIAGLAAGEQVRTVLRLRPEAGAVGDAVPLALATSYEDRQGQRTEEREVISLRVAPRDAVRPADVPVEITVRDRPRPTDEPRKPLEALELPLTLRFDAPDPTGAVTISWKAEDIGEVTSSFRSPYTGDDLRLVIRALDELHTRQRGFDRDELARLVQLGLVVSTDSGQLLYESHRAVGRRLYDALVSDREADKALAVIRNAAVAQSRPAIVHLHFVPQAVELATLPWELIWDDADEPLLLSRGQMIACVRHLDLPQALPPTRPGRRPLRLVAVIPSAGISPALRAEEQERRRAALAPLVGGDMVMDEISGRVTRQRLNDYLRGLAEPPDIIHFFGHGVYSEGQGYLVLDKDGAEGDPDPVPARLIARLFRNARLVVLHACQSAAVSDAGLLTGVAPSLSAAGVPAVVAMQLMVRIPAAIRFAEILYSELSRGASLHNAVSRGRDVLYTEGYGSEDESWYVPTLTVRTRDAGPMYL